MIEKEYTDEELVQMLQNDSEEAFNLLYQRYVKLVYYIAYRFCKNDADSQDIVQETFLQVKRMIRNINNPALFKFWLNQITVSRCKNLFRKNKYVTYDDEHYEVKNNLTETREDVLPEAIKATDTKLNFRSLDGLIAQVLFYSFTKTVLPKAILIPVLTKQPSIWKQISSAISIKSALAAATAFSLLTFTVWNDRLIPQEEQGLVNRFPAVTIRSTKITNAREAYFHIKTWACCHEEMELIEIEKLDDVYYLYQVMKRDRSVYYSALVNEGWASDLEYIYNERIRLNK